MSRERAELPEGWEWVKLGEVAQILNGYAFDSNNFTTAQGIPLIRIRDLKTQVPSTLYSGTYDEQYLINKGDLLIGMDGEFRCYLWEGPTSLLNQRVCRVIPDKERLDLGFLAYALNDHLREIEDATPFTTVKHLSSKRVLETYIAIPDLATQKHLTAHLNKQMTEVDKARAATEAQLEATKMFVSTSLNFLISRGREKGWRETTLNEALSDIQAGKSPNCEARPATNDEWGVLKVSAVSWEVFKAEENKAVMKDFAPLPENEVKDGDLLISRANTVELVGAVVLVQKPRPRLMLSNKTLRLVVDEEVASKQYLAYYLRSKIAREFIEGNATGTSPSMKNISQKTIGRIPLLLPSLEEQEQVVQKMSGIKRFAQDVIQSLQIQLQAINALPASLLRQAFSGQLKVSTELAPDVLSALLSCYTVQVLHSYRTFGITQLMKVLYFAQVHFSLPLHFRFKRHHFGPFDKEVYKLEEEAEQKGWFLRCGHGEEAPYKALDGLEAQVHRAEQALGNEKAAFDRFLSEVSGMDTRMLEALATLHAAWNDLLLEGQMPSDQEIISEVLEHWPGKAEKFTKGELRQYLAYLRTTSYLPKGTGQSTRLTHAT
jgi:type I restriction enzyme S subunit